MLVRPSQPLVIPSAPQPTDAWHLVERSQRLKPSSGWIIPQPAHSALSGEIAAKLSPDHFPGLSDDILRTIALHDTGWSAFDAQQIENLRSVRGFRPISFIAEAPDVYLNAWTISIDAAERISAAAGEMVSRHFTSVRSNAESASNAREQQQEDAFHAQERARQQRLAPLTGRTDEQREQLLQALRFSDLVSLFLCSNIDLQIGAAAHFSQNVTHSEGYVLRREPDAWAFAAENTPLREAAEMTFSGLSFGDSAKGGSWFTVRLR